MGLVRRGPERLGEVVEVGAGDGRVVAARITGTCFFDPEGAKQDV